MYFVEQFTHFIEEPAIPKFIQLDAQIWDTWLLKQKGVVGKQILIDIDKPYIVIIEVTWVSRDFLVGLDPDEISEAEAAMDEGMAGFAFELLKKDYFYAQTCLENGSLDDDDDQDDDDSIHTDPSYNPANDNPSLVSTKSNDMGNMNDYLY